MSNLRNVHPECIQALSQNRLAAQFASAVEEMFTITGYAKIERYRGRYTTLFCKPTATTADSLLLNREVLAILATYNTIDPRVVSVAREIIRKRSPQLANEIAIILHCDPDGDRKLRQWGKEQALRVVPVYSSPAGAQSQSGSLRQQLSSNLLAADPFQVTGPVADDADFFGRKSDAQDVLRQLVRGRIRAIFGMRKTGKTSFINRIVSLARQTSSLRIAMVDCSMKKFYQLDHNEALVAVARASRIAATRGYAHISDAISEQKGSEGVFSDLWLKEKTGPLALVFDEVDYITPCSALAPHWKNSFNGFWGELRVHVQEAQRHDVAISVLVSGVSSKFFRDGFVDGIENTVLHFVPDECLPPFSRKASDVMIAELSRRCGLQFSPESRDHIAEVCGDMPFWIRMAGSYIHRAIDADTRPQTVSTTTCDQLLEAFTSTDGAEISRIALQHLGSVYPEAIEKLRECVSLGKLDLAKGRLLVRYGLARQKGDSIVVTSELVRAGLLEIAARLHPSVQSAAVNVHTRQPPLAAEEWAEELAVVNRRRNLLEATMRQQIRFTIRADAKVGREWVSVVLKCMSEQRRSELAALSSATLMEKLYWMELRTIVLKNWELFERSFGDRGRFETAMTIANDRPDAHAKAIDAADLALQRRELEWLESRVQS